MHHCDWAATIVAAAGGVGDLNDTATPPVDSLNLWPALMDPDTLTGGPRKEVRRRPAAALRLERAECSCSCSCGPFLIKSRPEGFLPLYCDRLTDYHPVGRDEHRSDQPRRGAQRSRWLVWLRGTDPIERQRNQRDETELD